eukprot:TRINITY_DN6486_c0_g1_i1.p1 TRINITY_DN6486_c0_g1~~TRINITY_DN6486_c0_g1_i1.p1  ORF type:complete len:698 (+),score=212.24 TRINITY_DN6486_c0_g1_i1:68-2161(+)
MSGAGPAASQSWRHAPKRGTAATGAAGEDEAYFADDKDATAQPTSNGTGFAAVPGAAGEVDSFDAFMAEINAEVAKQDAVSTSKKDKKQAAPWELNGTDNVADFFEAHQQGKARKINTAGDVVEGNEDSDPEEEEEKGDRRDKAIEPLPAVDHSLIKYSMVETEFYKPHPEIASLQGEQLTQLRQELRISATGSNVPNPVASFGHLADSLGKELMQAIRQHGYQQPTSIQAQALPTALSGRDLIGIAETGSGKTAAYLLPMLVHAVAQPELKKDEGPIGVVLCPTRELAIQIEQEVFKFNRQLGLRSVTLAGGMSKLEQFKEIKRGCEVVVCNPGRLIDIVKMKGCNLRRVTFVVLDEADRMFHMGFEYQVRSIMQNVRPSRQTLLFSATFPPKIEKLARDILHQPVRITIGQVGQAALSVEQSVEVLKNDEEKWQLLSKKVDGMLAKGQVLIFVKSIASAEELTQNFTDFLDKKTEFLHGDLDQTERMRILRDYKKRKFDVLIATDVAARGLDIPTIQTVVSYDLARDIETHTHRIGRTGRAGAKGEALTLITQDKENFKMAALLAESIEMNSQFLSEDLKLLAMKHGPYRTAKLSGKKFENKKKGQGGGGASVHSAFGLGFDGQQMQKETTKDLEKRLNKEADQMVAHNRRIMQNAGRGRLNVAAAGAAVPAAKAGLTGGFVVTWPVKSRRQLCT